MKEHFNNLGFEINGLLHLSAKEAFVCLQNNALLVDVRTEEEIILKDFGMPGKRFCPFADFEKLYAALPKNQPLIIADCVGLFSKEAALMLLNHGFTRVANLVGGIAQWERDGLPMRNDNFILSGQCPCTMRPRNKQRVPR